MVSFSTKIVQFSILLCMVCVGFCLGFSPMVISNASAKANANASVNANTNANAKASANTNISNLDSWSRTPVENNTSEKLQVLSFEAKVLAPEPQDGFDDHSKLIKQGFQDLLVRLTGTEKIMNKAEVSQALKEVDQYVTQFGFQLNEKKERVFKVTFDEALCRSLLENAGQAIVAPDSVVSADNLSSVDNLSNVATAKSSSTPKCPPVVLWLTMQQGNVTQWVGGEMNNELSQQLSVLAEKKGLTLLRPLLDLTDTSLLSEQQVWNEDLPALQAASKRYNADHILIGRLNKQKSGWYAQWTYIKEGKPLRFEMSNSQLTAVFGEAIDQFINVAANAKTVETADEHLVQNNQTGINQNVIVSTPSQNSLKELKENTKENIGEPKTLRLSIEGVRNGEQYVQVLKYLKSLPNVKEVEVAEIMPEQTVFNVECSSSKEGVIASIASGQLLTQNNSVDTINADITMNSNSNSNLSSSDSNRSNITSNDVTHVTNYSYILNPVSLTSNSSSGFLPSNEPSVGATP